MEVVCDMNLGAEESGEQGRHADPVVIGEG
jgi:hypothetical protein